MLYVVCYDIIDDRTRAVMAKRMLDFGTRIQDSVFECVMDEPLLERLLASVSQVPLADGGPCTALPFVRAVHVAGASLSRVQVWGPGEVTHDPAFFLV